jgi:hypothetical protein
MFNKIGSTLSNAATSAFESIGDQIGEIGSSLSNMFGNGHEDSAELQDGDLIFPIELAKGDRPTVEFTCFIKQGDDSKPKRVHTYFPIPAGLSFSDSAEYNNVNLGMLGGAVFSAAQKAIQDQTGVQGAAKEVLTKMTSTGKSEAASIAVKEMAKKLSGQQDAISLATRKVANPNTNVTFTGHGVRTFSFAFKMIAKSQKEAKLIRKINERFRHYTYANLVDDETGFMLSFPPTWLIRFYDAPEQGSEFKEIIHIPRIFSCYLTGVNSTFNAGQNTFYNDGAPVEVDMTLEFQETRALTRKDIQHMENDKLGNRGVGEDGRPIVSTQTEPSTPQTTTGGKK